MAKSREELNNLVDQMVEILGAEEMLNDFTKALSSDELQENLEYIDRMQDLNLF